MKINLEKIKYRNILSVGNNPIEVELNKHFTTFITGRNGASKSTIIEAIIFALFGRPYRNITKPQLVNSVNKKNLEVELWFNIDNKVKYYIKRGIKPNVFEIHKNDVELVEDASVRDFQTYLENNILKMNYRTAKQIVALGTAGFTPFMQLRTFERREVVEDLLDIKIFSKMSEDNKVILTNLSTELEKQEYVIANKTKEKQLHEKFVREILNDKESKIKDIEEKKTSYETELADLKTKKELYEDQIKRLTEALVEISIEENQTDVSNLHSINVKIKNIQKGIDFFKEHSKCPTCKQFIEQEYISKKIDQYESEKITEQTKVQEIEAKIEKFKQNQARNSKILSKRNDISTLLNSCRYKIKSNSEYIEQLEKEIEKIQIETKNIDLSAIEKLTNDLTVLTEKKSVKLTDRHCHNTVANVLKDNAAKARIISQYIPIINKLINNYLQIMDANYKFELDNEFNETIKSRGREEFSYNSFSQGEKMRIDLAILFTWRELIRLKNSSTFNILFMDEIMDGATDQDGIDAIMNIIKAIKNNVFIISHNDKIDPSQFDNHLCMVKKGNFSQIEESV